MTRRAIWSYCFYSTRDSRPAPATVAKRHRQAEVDSVSRIAAVTSPQPTQDNVQLPQGAGLSIHTISVARFAHFPDGLRRG